MRAGACAVAVWILGAASAAAAGSGVAFVANERDDTITILAPDHSVLDTIQTCARPRGMHFSADHTELFVGCADDDQIAIYDVATRTLKRRIRGVPAPETFDLHPDGRRLIVSNEEDALASVYDVETGELLAEYEQTGGWCSWPPRPQIWCM
jgi:tricorn protease-like protein